MTKCGFVALLGEPNAGKSTLLNRMVGSKVSIVTHKVQTTRSRIRGVTKADKTQIIFVDTPGVFNPRRGLDRAMVAAAWEGVADAEVVILIIEAQRGITNGVKLIISELTKQRNGQTALLAINKMDRVRTEALLPLTKQMNMLHPFAKTFLISAEKGYGLDELKSYLAKQLPEGPWLYPEDQIADLPMRMIAAEITREKLILRLHQELPYQLTVETKEWQQCRDGSVRINQVVYVLRDGHKGIVLGKNGQTVKAISMAARDELEELLELKVHLFIHVKVRQRWLKEPQRYDAMGLRFQDSRA